MIMTFTVASRDLRLYEVEVLEELGFIIERCEDARCPDLAGMLRSNPDGSLERVEVEGQARTDVN